MPNDENKPAPEVRQPVAHEIGANFEGRGNLSASVGLAQAVAATFEGRGNLSPARSRPAVLPRGARPSSSVAGSNGIRLSTTLSAAGRHRLDFFATRRSGSLHPGSCLRRRR